MIFRFHTKVFFTIFAKLIKSTDSTFGRRTRRGHLTEAQLVHRTGICNLLIGREKNHHFLNSLVNGNDKLIVYKNLKRKRSWSIKVTPKADLHQKKVMLSIWWDWKGILYYKLLPPNKMINLDIYCEQLENFKKIIEKKNAQNWSTRGALSSITTMHDLILLWRRRKNWES